MNVRLTHIDGKLPNLALMKLAHYHRERGDSIVFSRQVERDMLEPEYDRVYGSAIFSQSADRVAEFKTNFPAAIVGGTWKKDRTTVEDVLGIDDAERFDYSIYPTFDGSIGFTQRGCRFKCGHCVVPWKEGGPVAVNTVSGLWRGEPYPHHLCLLDNDFFGQPRDQWEARISEIKDGKFKVCWNQGINIRMINDDSAAALASVGYYDDSFKVRRLYTAWDNVGNEGPFFRGVATLERHGIPPSSLMVYMLIGYDKRETWERVFYRFKKMTTLKIRPYPMVYNTQRFMTLPLGGYESDCCPRKCSIAHRTLGEFQRWVIRKAYNFIPFAHYDVNAKGHISSEQLEMPIVRALKEKA